MDTHPAKKADDLINKINNISSLLQTNSTLADATTRMSDEVAEALRSLGAYRMFRPGTRGGLGFDPVSAFRVVEALARIDSAAAWNVAVANGCEVFGAWFTDATTAEIFADPDVTLAGGLFPPRKAEAVEGGYRVSGRTLFNSNCHAANWLLCEAMIYDGGAERFDAEGNPQGLFLFLPITEATIVENWDTLGMRGTGSHDIEVNDVFVPASRTAALTPLQTTDSAYADPLYRLGIWPALAINGVAALGVAQAAIDDFIELAHVKTPAYTARTLRERPIVQLRLAEAEAHVRAARALMHQTFNRTLAAVASGGLLTIEQKADCQQATSHMVMEAAKAVNLIHSIASTSAIRNDKPFARYFRDVHVMTQHAFFCEARLEAVGQIRMGLESDWDFMYF